MLKVGDFVALIKEKIDVNQLIYIEKMYGKPPYKIVKVTNGIYELTPAFSSNKNYLVFISEERYLKKVLP